MNQPYGEQPGGEPTTRFGDPYRAEQPPHGGQPAYPPPQQGYRQQQGYPQQQPSGQQGRYSAAANAYGAPVGSGAKFGVVGATLAGVGAILLIISFTAVNWFNGSHSGFSDISDQLDGQGNAAPGLASAYFSWLGWVLAIALVVIAIAANLPSPASGPLRAFGAILAAAGIAVTFFAIRFSDGVAYTEFLKHARLGFYLALAGFLIAGIGALVGPKDG
jgi:hypothetical protein